MQKPTIQVIEAHLFHIRESLQELKENEKTISKRLGSQEKVLLRNTITVEEHKRRSDKLEENQEKFIATLDQIAKSVQQVSINIHKIENEIEPIKDHVKSVKGVMGIFIAMYDNKEFIGKLIVFATVIAISAYYGLKELRIF